MFNIPEDLAVFALEGLRDLRRIALDELNSIRASATPETVTDEQLARGTQLKEFISAADAEISRRQERTATFNSFAVEDGPEDNGNSSDTTNDNTSNGQTVTASADDTDTSGTTAETGDTTQPVDVNSVASQDSGTGTFTAVPATKVNNWPQHSVVAAADIPEFSTGAELDSWYDVGKAFVNRTRGYKGNGAPLRHSIVEIKRDFGSDFTLTREEARDPERVEEKLKYVTDESRLPGGSLTAANVGWCPPSENLYSTCNQIGMGGMVSMPEITVARGGINHNQGIEFDTVFGNGTGFNILTEDQVISGTQKTCVEIPCPEFVDDRLKVSVLCLTGSILQNRAYPEFVSQFIQGAMAVHAHNVNRQIIADVVNGSVAVDLTTAAPWNTDSSVASQTLAAVEHAIVDIRYRLRLDPNTTLEVWLPDWIRAQYRADVSRQNGTDLPKMAVTDAMLANWFSVRGARPQYLYDWQDAFSNGGVGYGADTPLATPPTSVQFVVYPAGTWVLGRQDVIRLDSVYDSVNLPDNKVTQLFMEDGFRAMRMCPLSRAYTIDICPTGNTSDVQMVTCGS